MNYREVIHLATPPDTDPIRVVRTGSMLKIEQLDEYKRVAKDIRLHIGDVPGLIHALKELLK